MKRALFIVFVLLVTSDLCGQDIPPKKNIRPTKGLKEGIQGDQNGDLELTRPSQRSGQKGGLKGGKLLDDTTKQIYGPTTTRYTFEKNIKYNDSSYYVIDTLLTNIHQFNYVNNYGNKRQDLGVIGTASMPMFIQLPKHIGVMSGIKIYDEYQRMPDDIKYYDTHSPFTDLNIVMGGNNRAITQTNYSRNINPKWNVGFDFHGLFVDKQLHSSGKGDRLVLKNSYNIYTHYTSDNELFQLMFNFIRNLHKVEEFGGVYIGDEAPVSDFFEEDAQINLTGALAQELRLNFHLYQQYYFSDLIQTYYQVDRYKQMNDYNDDLSKATEGFYDWMRYSTSLTTDRIDFHSITQEFGVKGDIGHTFYNVYYKHRNFDAEYNNVEGIIKGREEYGGANIRYEIDSTSRIHGFAEYRIGGDYKLGAKIEHKLVSGSAQRLQYQPAMVERFYHGNHDLWINDFVSTTADEIEGQLHLKFKSLQFEPKVRAVALNDYIYYDTTGVPQQSDEVQLLSAGYDLHFKFLKRFHLSNEGLFAKVEGNSSDVIRVPEMLFNAQLYYQNTLFNGNLQLQVGFDANWKTAYYANAYDPAIQQFHLQDNFEISEFGLVDFFLNLKINRGRLFIKYINLPQAFSGTGYFTTPNYIGQINGVDFGFRWAFYD